MSYGFEVKSNLDSSVMVDQNTPAMVFVGKGTNSTPSATDSRNVTYVYNNTSPVISGSMMPVCFIASSQGVLTKMNNIVSIGGNQWRMTIYQNSSTAVDVYWFINPVGLTASSDTYGLRIYDSSGSLIVDSGWGTYGSVEQIVSISNSDGATTTMTAMTKPAFLHFNSFMYIVYAGSVQYWGFRYFNYLNSTTFKLQDDIWFQGSWIGSVGSGSGGSGGTINVPILEASIFD